MSNVIYVVTVIRNIHPTMFTRKMFTHLKIIELYAQFYL